MLYSYHAYGSDGKPVRGTLYATDERDAARRLLELGLYAGRIVSAPAPRPFRTGTRAALYRELGALLSAGLPLDRALDILTEQMPDFSAVLDTLREGVRSGRGLAAPLSETASGASSFERAILASAEKSATLPMMLGRLADFLETEDATRASIRSALIYPSFVLTLGLVVATVMLGVVVPKTTAVLADAGMELPASSRYLVQGARILLFLILPLLGAAVAAFFTAKLRARKNRTAAVSLDRFLLRLPGMGPVRLRAAQRFASVFGILLESGTTVPDAIPLSAAAMGHPHLETAVLQARDRIVGGASPAKELASVPYLGVELAQWIRVGEAGGCLPAMLSVASSRLDARATRALSSRIALLEPSLLAAVGLFTLALALALLLPVLNLRKMAG